MGFLRQMHGRKEGKKERRGEREGGRERQSFISLECIQVAKAPEYKCTVHQNLWHVRLTWRGIIALLPCQRRHTIVYVLLE